MEKTYLVIWFNSDGSEPSEVNKRIMDLGFEPAIGNYDYVYEWDKDADIDDLFELADQLHQTLKGTKTLYKVESV